MSVCVCLGNSWEGSTHLALGGSLEDDKMYSKFYKSRMTENVRSKNFKIYLSRQCIVALSVSTWEDFIY